jgi:hypothetical protein
LASVHLTINTLEPRVLSAPFSSPLPSAILISLAALIDAYGSAADAFRCHYTGAVFIPLSLI